MKLLDQLVSVVGGRHVLTGSDAAKYGVDFTEKYKATPLAVIRPANTAEVSAVMALAFETGTPVVPIGGNTGLVGGTYAPDCLMLSLERLNAIREIRVEARVAIVEAGVILSKLHDAADNEGLVFPLTFGARGSAMIGGNLATNAGGSNVVRYGSARALCMGLEVVLPDGQVMDLMTELHKDNSGLDLKDLFIGAEGTLGIITAAVVKLVPKPGAYATAMVAAKSVAGALEMLNRLQEASGGMVEAFELMPKSYIQRLGEIRPDLKPPLGYEVENTILVELGATAPRDVVPLEDGSVPVVNLLEDALVGLIEDGLALDASIAQSETQRRNMWSMREAAAEITLGRRPSVDTDLAVPLDKVAVFLERATARVEAIDPGADTFTVCHLGDGNLHFTVWPTKDDDTLHDALREMVEDVTLELGGSFSAEHGIGLSKLNSMARRKDAVALTVMRQIKAAIDPKGIMNPGKVLP
ncbi:MAG: FAD-binding oxidoreductase [Paracoccaceae bacterium]